MTPETGGSTATTATTTTTAPTTAAEAAARLETLSADPKWAERLFAGYPQEGKEFADLSKLLAAKDPTAAAMAGVHPAAFGPANERLAAETVPLLREWGLSDGAIEEALTGTPISQGVHDQVKQFRAMRMADRDWAAKLLRGDPYARKELMLMQIVLLNPIAEEKTP